jgi:hypothetical protein
VLLNGSSGTGGSLESDHRCASGVPRQVASCFAGMMRQSVSECISAVTRPLDSLSLSASDLRGLHPNWMKVTSGCGP